MKRVSRRKSLACLVFLLLLCALPISAAQAGWVRLQLSSGVTAWHRVLPATRTTSIRICLPGASTISAEAPAADRLLFALMQTAGEKYSRAQLDRIRDEGAIDISGTSDADLSTLSATAIADKTADAAALLASLFVQPTRDQAILSELRTQAVNQMRWTQGNAWNYLGKELLRTIFGTRPEGVFHALSDTHLAAASQELVFTHHRNLLASGRAFIVSCGPLSLPVMSGILSTNLASLPRQKNSLPLEERPLPLATNAVYRFPHPAASSAWVKGILAAPRPGTPDYPAFVIAARIWSEILMDSVRTQHGLVYSVWASSPSRQRHASADFVLYRCQNIPKAIKLAESSLRALRSGTASLASSDGKIPARTIADLLPAIKNQLLAAIALQNITPAERTATFASWLLASGQAEAFETLPAAIRSVSAEQVRLAACNHFQAMHWGMTLSPEAASNLGPLRWNP